VLQEFMRVLDRVRMWKGIPQSKPDFAVVCVLCQRFSIIQPPRANQALFQNELHRSLTIEFDTRFLHFAVRQQPDERFVVEVDYLDTIAPWIVKIATKRWLKFELVFLCEFLPDFLKLRLITNHDPEMPRVCALNFFDLKNREELVLAQFEESVTLTATHLFEIENILVKGHRLLNVIHLDRDMIASIHLHAHISP
jgi:hypothetical protein